VTLSRAVVSSGALAAAIAAWFAARKLVSAAWGIVLTSMAVTIGVVSALLAIFKARLDFCARPWSPNT